MYLRLDITTNNFKTKKKAKLLRCFVIGFAFKAIMLLGHGSAMSCAPALLFTLHMTTQ